MKTILVPVIKYEEDSDAVYLIFSIEHDFDSKEAMLESLRKEIAYWLHSTEGGDDAMVETCGDFNWGDVAHYLQPFMEKVKPSGIRSITVTDASDANFMVVDHDELLYEVDY